MRQCLACGEIKALEEFHKQKNGKFGRTSHCKICRKPKSKSQWSLVSIEARLLQYARIRAQRKDREFTIELQDIVIPTNCPVLGIPMHRPSIDRKDSSLGYTKDNIRVISHRANVLKNDATIQELELILVDLKGLIS